MRKSKQDWLEVGLHTLGQVGANNLTIEHLTNELGVTKGSFYHHFKNARDFQEQLIAYWADQYLSTSTVLPEDPLENLTLLDTIMSEAFSPITEPEIAIRIWAQQDEMVSPVVEQVDAVRHGFLYHVFWAVTQDEKRSRMMADMLFTISIGSLTALPRIPPERVLEMYQELKRLYGLGG